MMACDIVVTLGSKMVADLLSRGEELLPALFTLPVEALLQQGERSVSPPHAFDDAH